MDKGMDNTIVAGLIGIAGALLGSIGGFFGNYYLNKKSQEHEMNRLKETYNYETKKHCREKYELLMNKVIEIDHILKKTNFLKTSELESTVKKHKIDDISQHIYSMYSLMLLYAPQIDKICYEFTSNVGFYYGYLEARDKIDEDNEKYKEIKRNYTESLDRLISSLKRDSKKYL